MSARPFSRQQSLAAPTWTYNGTDQPIPITLWYFGHYMMLDADLLKAELRAERGDPK